MRLETMMIKAIRELKKVSTKAEIRSIFMSQGDGSYKKWKSATFCIDYVERDCGEYRIAYITIDDQNNQPTVGGIQQKGIKNE